MPAGDEGNRQARHGGLFQDTQLLVDGVPPPTLDGIQNLNSFDTARHSRNPSRTPSLSLCSGVRSKWVLLHAVTICTGAPSGYGR